jgi:hypothetical protein
MKPFNLEDALAGKPVCTRDGRPVKIAGYNPDALEHASLLGWAANGSCSWFPDGNLLYGRKDALDLFMVSEKHKVTRFMHSHRPGEFGYETAEECEEYRYGPNDKIVEVTLEWED